MTTLEMLLSRLANGGAPLPAPAPSKPIPLSVPQPPLLAPPGPAPDMPPIAPTQPIDMGFVDRYAGAAPVAPTIQPASTLQKIAAVLSGVALGPQYGAQLREERDRPMREYNQAQQNYQERRGRGLEIAERRAERQQEAVQRQADERADREFKVWLQRTGVQDQMAIERMQRAHQLERDATQARLETARELEREQRRREDDARTIAGRLGSGPGAAPPHIAKELGEFYANVRQSVSPAAAKWVNAQARRAELLARPAVGGGAVSRRETLDLQRRQAQAAAGIAQMERLARQAMETTEDKRPPILAQMRSLSATLQAQFPDVLETGEHNHWPFARLRLRGSQATQQPQPAPVDPLQLGVK